MRFIQHIFLLITIPFCCIGQEIIFHRPSGNISQNTITSIVQDQFGFLWFGTRYGLNRYNGIEYAHFIHEPEKKQTLTNSSIAGLMVDSEGDLWVGTSGGGISIFDKKKQCFNCEESHKALLQNLGAKNIVALHEDQTGNVWIGTEFNGLKQWHKETGQLRHFFADGEEGSIASNTISAITEDNYGNVWVGTFGGGLCIYVKTENVFFCYSAVSRSDLPEDNKIRALYQGEENVWIGTESGIRKLRKNEKGDFVFQRILSSNPELNTILNTSVILSILEDSQLRLWIGTENKGLFLYDLGDKTLTQFQQDARASNGLSSNSIWSLYEDVHGTIWIGTHKNGVDKIDPFEQKFQKIPSDPYPFQQINFGLVSTFSEGPSGNIWVGTDGVGLYQLSSRDRFSFQKLDMQYVQGLTSNQIVCLEHDQKGNLWIGTWGEGIYIKDVNTDQIRAIPYQGGRTSSTSGKDILALYKDKNGDIWISSFRDGLDRYAHEEQEFYHYYAGSAKHALSSNKIRAIAQDADDYLWIGMEGAGLDRIKFDDQKAISQIKNFGHNVNNPQSLSNSNINCIYLDQKDQLWIGTDGGGLDRYNANAETFEHFTLSDGLPSNVIYGVLEDEEGLLWVSTNNGLASINLEQNEIQKYDIADGLQGNEFYKSACLKLRDGTLLFGGINGFNFFNPGEIVTNKVVPKVYITSLEIQGSSSDKEESEPFRFSMPTGKIQLKSNQNDLRIEFAALNYSQSTKNEYTYRLRGYDMDWRHNGNLNFVNLLNISPGTYVFEVIGSNNDGLWNDNAASLEIIILNPWYRTNLAYVIYSLFVGGLLFSIYYVLIQRERFKNRLEMEHLELTKMQEFSEIRSQFFANISHEFKTPLTLILSPLKGMIREKIDAAQHIQVNLMLRNAERLLQLINQILSLSKLESGVSKLKAFPFDIVSFTQEIASNFENYAQEQVINYQIDVPNQSIEMFFEKDKMEKILINILSNAFKFTPEYGSINLKMEIEGEHLVIFISDSGIGIPIDQIDLIFNRYHQVKTGGNIGNGIGLALTKQLVELHSGKIKVSSRLGEGTTFKLSFPLGHAHLNEDQIEVAQPQYSLSEESAIELKEFIVKPSLLEDLPSEEEENLPLILIADDNPDIRAFTRTYLQTKYQIIEAENGEEAFKMAQQHIPDIIITDLMMPKMNGYELCTKLREDEKTSHVYIIMFTVKSSEESKEKGFELGADHYVTKPFNPKLLDLRINNILNMRDKNKDHVLKNKALNIEPVKVNISSRDEEFLNKIMAIIEENISNSEFNINDLCRQIGFSKSQLYRKMKGLLGQSANEFIRAIRLKHAAVMLLQGQFNISEVTYQVGFNDLKYFRNCFKKQYGLTPSEYIQANRN